MTDKELRDVAVAALRKTTVTYQAWEAKRVAGKYPDVLATQWGKAFDALDRIGVEPPPPPVSAHSWWRDQAPVNTPIPASPTVVVGYGQQPFPLVSGIGWNAAGWSVGQFKADTGTARYRVNLTSPHIPAGTHFESVPIPDPVWAYVDRCVQLGDGERHLVIREADKVWNLYGLAQKAAGATQACYTGGLLSASHDGHWDNLAQPAWVGRASGFSSVTGAILASEMQAGRIDHALACCMLKGHIRSSFVSPASSSDGSGGSTGFQMGARLQLDPALGPSDWTTMGIVAAYHPVCVAMQKYGIFVVDSSGWMALYVEQAAAAGYTYPAGYSAVAMAKLIPRMRVVAPPAAPLFDTAATAGEPK